VRFPSVIQTTLAPLAQRVWSFHIQIPPLSPLGERVARAGAFTRRHGPGEGVEPPQAAGHVKRAT
jgi:hypothetical protein